jgi:chemotaxis protein histidine kinase CheA
MVLFEDMTNILLKEKELEKEKIRKETETESITAILKQGTQTFSDFIDASNHVLEEIEKNIDKLILMEILDQIFRDLHSLKGFARVLELNTMADKLHKFENIFSILRNKQKPINNKMKEMIMFSVTDLLEEKKNIKKLLDMILSFNRFVSDSSVPKSKILLDNFIVSLKDMVNSVSNELDKEIIFITHMMIDDFPYLNKLRNAIDHGIEDKFDRLTINKNQKGTVIFKLYKDAKNYLIEITDDGGGLDFEMLKKKAEEQNDITGSKRSISKIELIKMIFSPNFSSKDIITDISGRGFGLNIVKNDVEKLNGKIIVSIVPGKGTKFILKIPDNIVKMAMPAKSAFAG